MIPIESRHYVTISDPAEQAAEWALCENSPAYFIGAYCWVFNATDESWIPFELWPAQSWAIMQILSRKLIVILKARQLGFTWLILGFCLWLMLFRPAATIGIFSRTETDAAELLGVRLKGMYERLPDWMRARAVLTDNAARWVLSNGSSAAAFATTGGRQYTFSFILADEADFQPDLPEFMRAVKPTIDAGGRMVLLSTADKGDPASLFKMIYRAAKQKANEWLSLFLPWTARPGRDLAWYRAQKRDALANTGTLDDVHQEYPATDTQALAPRVLGKRIPGTWLEQCYVWMDPLIDEDAPSVPGLRIYVKPQLGRRYCIGLDPAEGNPTSDDSGCTVTDLLSGEEVASFRGKYQPSTFAEYADQLGRYYNDAGVMPERNNHGHAVIGWLKDNSKLKVLPGHDGNPGWLSSSLGKSLLYNAAADAFKDKQTLLHSFDTYTQLASIEGSTLRAPEGFLDDLADSYALAEVGRAAMLKDKSNIKVIAGAVSLFNDRRRKDIGGRGGSKSKRFSR